jgi:hypothetical protein
MLVAGIIVACIASIIRAWGLLNYKRGLGETPLIFSGLSGKLFLSLVTTVSIILGLVGAILIGYETSFLVGLIVFVAFWFLSGIWVSFLELIGL